METQFDVADRNAELGLAFGNFAVLRTIESEIGFVNVTNKWTGTSVY